jgi:type IV pilus assembly protein PilE
MRMNVTSYRPDRASLRGFTLVEVMIAVIVAGILAAIALPSFMAQIRASRRADAVATLSLIQQAQERWRANCPCYAGSLTAAPHATNPGGCPTTDCAATNGLGLTFSNPRYTYSMPEPPALPASQNTYTIRATPTGNQAQDAAGGTPCNPLQVRVLNGVPTNSPAACFRQ